MSDLRFTDCPVPRIVLEHTPNWVHAHDEEGRRGQDESTIKPQRQQKRIDDRTHLYWWLGGQCVTGSSALAVGCKACTMGDNMTPEQWKELLNRLQLVKSMSDLSPLALSRLEEYEMRHASRLPQSYKDFCTVFGGGEIGGEVRIAVPSREGELTMFSLEKINSIAQGLEYEVYSPNPQQHKRPFSLRLTLLDPIIFLTPTI